MPRKLSHRTAFGLPLATLALAASSAFAATQGPADDSFYNTVDPSATATHGDLISYRKTTTFNLGKDAPASSAWNVLYQSKDSLDSDNVVSGTVFVPQAAWTGTGPRPVILYAIGTQGLAGNCAPSRQFAAGTEYENSTITQALKAGYAVLVTDYEGYLTGGLPPTYMSGLSQGRAVLDIFKAATSIPSVGISATAPVAIWGYSQGGQASSFAGEIYSSYAPSLKVVGVATGGIPGDFVSTAKYLDGSYGFAFLGLSIVGLSNQYGQDIPINLIASTTPGGGVETLNRISGECIFKALFDVMGHSLSEYTIGNQPLDQLLQVGSVKATLQKQALGTNKVPAPVYQYHGAADEFIPLDQAFALKKAWCAKGTKVTFDLYPSEHIATLSQAGAPVLTWLADRFAGKAATDTCGTTTTPKATAIAPGGDLVVEMNKWPLAANVHLKLLNSNVPLPAGTSLVANANVTKHTLTGTLTVPNFNQKVNLIGLKLPVGLQVTSAGDITGTVDLDDKGILHVHGKAPVNINITSLVYIPFGACKTITPIDFPLDFDGPISALGGGMNFSGTVTFPKITGCAIQGTLSTFFSGSGNTYSFTLSPPAPVKN